MAIALAWFGEYTQFKFESESWEELWLAIAASSVVDYSLDWIALPSSFSQVDDNGIDF